MIVSFVVIRFGDESAWRTTFGGDFVRFDGNIRWVCFTGTGTEVGVDAEAGGNVDAVGCVVFDFTGGRYARVNRDRCALDCWASEKKEKKEKKSYKWIN